MDTGSRRVSRLEGRVGLMTVVAVAAVITLALVIVGGELISTASEPIVIAPNRWS